MKKIEKIKISRKPTYLKLDFATDFFDLFKIVNEQFDVCFLLESLGEQSSLSRYSLIGFDPEKIISAKDNNLFINKEKYVVKNPYKTLREITPQDAITRRYAGGLVGFLSYEALNYFEPSVKVKTHELFDQFKFGVYTDGLVFDKITGELYYFFNTKNRIEKIKKLLTKVSKKKSTFKAKHLGDGLTQEEHKKVVERVREQIIAGNTFQCEVGFKSEFKINGDTLKIYEKLREVNPSPFMYYLKFGEQRIIGASPELLFKLQNGDMETYPLAGTIKRGKNEKEDQALARKLLNDPKEIAEHNMLVDLHRNDLGRVARFGTVKVRSLMDIKKFSHVQHISSEITGVLKEGEDMFTALAANFPAGTLTGAPKIESIKIIDSFEREARGPYGGAVGQFGFNGDCTFAIAIRSLFVSGKYAYSQTSGGIVYDSDPVAEYEEIQRKLAAMKEVLTK